ncbi:hypothetical protein BH18ACT4_BH18ACT4_06260 [soil metagenome]
MALTKPALASAVAGHPITAQGWNDITTGVLALYDAVLALGTGSAEISVVAGGAPVAGAKVIAEPLGEGTPVAALAPFGGRTTYLMVGVTPGNWRVHVEAGGFTTEQRDVSVPLAETLVVPLTPSGSTVPDLFALGAQDAKSKLAEVGLQIERIMDVTGQDVSPFDIPADHQNSSVLSQLPAAGAVVNPTVTRVRLVVAAALGVTDSVTMPSLVGLTYDEMVQVLTGLGLAVGKTTIKQASASVRT